MDSRWQKIEEAVSLAADIPASKRQAWLEEFCAGDHGLYSEIESLLKHETSVANFLEQPIAPYAANLLTQDEEKSAGQIIGPYRIIREIGRGGMGVVYLATREDEQFHRQVAIKLVKRGLDTEDILRRFRNERQILASLNHPNIASLLDGGMTDDGLPYFVLEYIEGEPLDRYCDQNKLATPARLQLFREVCAAVQYAHQNLIVHRDLKPSNILVNAEGQPKLLDFGIAKLLNSELAPYTIAHTATQARLLTPDYASPEQIRGKNITTASDVYGLGILLYRLLTGHAPYRFANLSTQEIERLVCDTEPERPSTAISRVEEVTTSNGTTRITPETVGAVRDEQPEALRRRLQGDLDNIVLMAMRKEPERRYQSAAQMSEDIRRYVDGLPVNARPNTFAYRTEKFIKRNRVAVAAAVLVAISLVGGMVTTTWQARAAARQRDEARREKGKAEQLNNFLQTILSSAAPVEKGKDARVVDVIDDAAQRLETEFANQPELRAAALLSIGNTYRTLGLVEKQETTLSQALKLNTELYGEENAATALCIIYFADSFVLKGKNAEAEKLLTKGIEIERRLAPTGNKDLAFALRALGEVYNRKPDYNKAMAVLQESVSIYDEVLGKGNPDSAAAILYMGRTKEFSGDLVGAEAIYRQSIAAFRPMPKRYENRLAVSLYNLGNVLITERKYAEGISAIREGEAIYQRTGDATIYTFSGKYNLSRAYLLAADYPQAIAEGLAALDIGRKIGVQTSTLYIIQLEFIGLALTRSGKAKEGEPYLRQSVELGKANMGSADSNIPAMESALGECLTAQNRFAEAEPLLLQSFEKLKALQGEKGRQTGNAAERLVTLYEKLKKPDLAAKYQPFVPAKP